MKGYMREHAWFFDKLVRSATYQWTTLTSTYEGLEDESSVV